MNWKKKCDITEEKLDFQMEMFVLEEDRLLREIDVMQMEDNLKVSVLTEVLRLYA